MAYNMTWIDNTTTFPQMLTQVNILTNNTFGIYLLVFTFIICFSVFRDYDVIDNIYVSTFIVLIVGGLLMAISMLTWEILVAPIMLFVSIMIAKFFKKD